MDIDATKSVGGAGGKEPQKYIRTFAGDMAVVERGGVPDLAPLIRNGQGAPVAAPSNASPQPAVPVSPKVMYETPAIETPELPGWKDEKKEVEKEDLTVRLRQPETDPNSVFSPPSQLQPQGEKIVVGSSSTEPEWPVLAPFPIVQKKTVPLVDAPIEIPPPPPLPISIPTSIHTYSEDFRDHIVEKQASTTSILAAEQDAAPIRPFEPEETSDGKHKMFVIAVSVVLVISGFGGMYFAYQLYAQSRQSVVVTSAVVVPISVDERGEITGTGTVLIQGIKQSLSEPLSAGKVRLLSSLNATTTRRSIFVSLQVPAPDVLLRNIDGMRSIAGVVTTSGGSPSPFFILSVRSYNDTFAGMLSWERSMPSDLGGLFPAYSSTQAVSPTAVATTPVFVPTFRDEVMMNHDVRVYRDSTGKSIILYGYWNQSTLVIARDQAAFIEILGRLANAHTQP